MIANAHMQNNASSTAPEKKLTTLSAATKTLPGGPVMVQLNRKRASHANRWRMVTATAARKMVGFTLVVGFFSSFVFVLGEDTMVGIVSTVPASNRLVLGLLMVEHLVLLASCLAGTTFASTALGSVFLCKHSLLFGLYFCINLGSFAGLITVHFGWEGSVLLGCTRLCVAFA